MLTAALAALGAALSVAAWHTSAGVTLTPTEGASVAIGAALTAVSASAMVALGTRANTSSVDGSRISEVSPFDASTQRPPIYIW